METWRCGDLNFDGDFSSNPDVRDEFGDRISTVRCGNLDEGNFTFLCEGAGQKRGTDCSLEPRTRRRQDLVGFETQ